MTTYTAFLGIRNTTTGVVTDMKVVAYEESEYRWSGAMRPAFDNSMLSTLRTPKRQARATVEFLLGSDLDAFQATLTTGINPATHLPAALAPCLITSGITSTHGAVRTEVAWIGYVHITSKKPWFYEEGAVMKTGWIAELDIKEI